MSFGNPAISPDRLTVGWLAMYPDPSAAGNEGAQIPGKLVLFRGGRVLHRFTTEQVFWDWRFRNGGNEVAYSTGPTHGGASECVLRAVVSGRVASRWRVRNGPAPPAWARDLHQ